jgi:hypothetical protein
MADFDFDLFDFLINDINIIVIYSNVTMIIIILNFIG